VIPLAGFAPDMDPTQPGVITDCNNVIPFEGGMRSAPSPASVGAAALAASCAGASTVIDLSGNRRLFAGTLTKLYELNGATWTDRSRAGSYTLGTDDRWSFVQYANATIAATPSAVLQRSTSGAFADIAGAPQAKIVESAQGFVIAFNLSTNADAWYCSTYLDDTNWTLSVSNQCVTGRLIGSGGPLTAARRFGDNVIAYKAGSLYVGTYVGAPEVWRWAQVSADVGCVGQDAVVDTALGHVFVGRDNVYLYDGTTPRPLATGVIRRWLFADMSPAYAYKTMVQWDRTNNLVWIFYPSSGSSGTVDRCAVYHTITQRWGLAHTTIQAIVQFTSPTITFDGGSVLVTTYDASPAIPFESMFWISGTTAPGVFTSTNTLSTLAGTCASAYFITGDYGDDEGYRMCKNLRVRYTSKPTTSTATGYTKDAEGDSIATGSSKAMADGRHNMRQTARWHRFRVDTTGDFEVTAVRPEFKERGKR
jgi:hypothetical protein